MNQVNIVGMGMGPQDLTENHLSIIEQADVLVGGKRLLDFFKKSTARKKTISRDIDAVVEYVRKKMKDHRVVVLASGDPLFYGIGLAGYGNHHIARRRIGPRPPRRRGLTVPHSE